MFNQNIISNKFDLNWSTTFSYTRVEVNSIGKHSSLLRYGNKFAVEIFIASALMKKNLKRAISVSEVWTSF
jgi:hypothetical protein